MADPKRIRIIIAFAALYIVWGSTYLGILFAIQSIPAFLMAGARFVLAGLIMFLIARTQGPLKSNWGEWRTSIIVGACLLLGGNGGVTISEKFIETGLASLIVATVPIYITLLGWFFGMTRRPTPLVWAGLGGGFVGVGILLGPALRFSGSGNHHPLIGMSILLVGSFLWSAGSLYSRIAKHSAAPFLAAAQQMFCGGTLLMIVGLLAGEAKRFHPANITPLSLGAFVYLVLIGAIVGYTAYFWLLRNCDPAKVATYAYVNPIVAVILGAAFGGETVGRRTMLGAALILSGVVAVTTAKARKTSVPEAGETPEQATAD